MTTREKIIMGAMAVAVIGGGLHFALPSGGDKAARKPPPDFSALMTRVQVGLQQGELTPREQHALNTMAGEWNRDPFLAAPLVRLGPSEDDPAQGPLPVYTGYIDVGPRPIAVIDGRDYRQEELLQNGEYRVRKILPDRVELVRRGSTDPLFIFLKQERNL